MSISMMGQKTLREEQKRLQDDITKMKRRFKSLGHGYAGVRGDSLVRIVRRYLRRHIPANVKLVKNAWVEDCGLEFDLMIVDRQSKLWLSQLQKFANSRESIRDQIVVISQREISFSNGSRVVSVPHYKKEEKDQGGYPSWERDSPRPKMCYVSI